MPDGVSTPHATSNTAMGSPTIHPETLGVLVIGAGISGCRHQPCCAAALSRCTTHGITSNAECERNDTGQGAAPMLLVPGRGPSTRAH